MPQRVDASGDPHYAAPIAMGFYTRHIVPRINDKMASGPVADRYRKQVLAPARGRVLEVGFGTGLNAAHYPAAVERVVALDDNPGVESLAKKRIAAATTPIEYHRASGEVLGFEDASFDTLVTTLVLCSIPAVERALGEFRRLLKPGGEYLFMEHGLADDDGVMKWQRRLNPVQMFMAGGCRLDRDIQSLVRGAGFDIAEVEQFYYPGAPRPMGFTTLGRARASSAPAT
jgi:SAM-dependent methyltransferase